MTFIPNQRSMRWNEMTRRHFVERTALATLGVSVAVGANQALAASRAGGKAKQVIYLYMGGGLSHIDTFDPKPGTEIQGPRDVVKTSSGEFLSENVAALAPHFSKMAVINTLTQRTGDHRGGAYTMHTGYSQRSTVIHPFLGSWAHKLLGPTEASVNLPQSVVIGGGGNHPGAGFLGPAFAPLPLGSATGGLPHAQATVGEEMLKDRIELLNEFNTSFTRKYRTEEVLAYSSYYDKTLELMRSKDLDAFDLAKEPEKVREHYGNHPAGQGMLLARRLVQNGVRFVEVNVGGHDNHSGIFDQGPTQNFRDSAQALAALLEDLEASGMLKETLVVMSTEFGRSPQINSNQGRDHHPLCFSGLLAGAGIAGGQKYGKSDANGYAVDDKPVTPADFNATIAKATGMPLDKVVFSPSGRPFLVAGHKEDPKSKDIVPLGIPIDEVLA